MAKNLEQNRQTAPGDLYATVWDTKHCLGVEDIAATIHLVADLRSHRVIDESFAISVMHAVGQRNLYPDAQSLLSTYIFGLKDSRLNS